MGGTYASLAKEAAEAKDVPEDLQEDDTSATRAAPSVQGRRSAEALRIAKVLAGLSVLLMGAGLTLLRPVQRWSCAVPEYTEEQLERQLLTVPEATAIVAAAAQTAQAVNATTHGAAAQLAKEAQMNAEDPTAHHQRAQTACALNVAYLPQIIAKTAANIKAAQATCKPDERIAHLSPRAKNLHSLICAVNIQFVIMGWNSLASSLASAAMECSDAVNDQSSLTPEARIDAGCAVGVSGLLEALQSFAISIEIVYGACDFAVNGMPPALVKELHENGMLSVNEFGQPGGESDEGRRLFLGGGKGTNTVLCIMDATQAATQLAFMALAIETAANVNCPARKPSGLTAQLTPPDINDALYRVSIASCSVDINRILKSIGAAAVYLSLTAIHCTGKLNLKAICAAGINGIWASLAGLGLAGSGAYLGCDVGQQIPTMTARTKAAFAKGIGAMGQQTLNQACTGFPLPCFLAWTAYWSPCPGGAGVSATCPQVPAAQPTGACPSTTDLTDCQTQWTNERTNLINAVNTWPPSPGTTEFDTLVGATPACFEYLRCLTNGGPFPGGRLLKEEDAEVDEKELRVEGKEEVKEEESGSGEAEKFAFELPHISLDDLSAEKDPQFPDLPPANAKVVRVLREQMQGARNRGLKEAEASGQGFQGFDLDTQLWDSIGHNLTALTEKVDLNDPDLESERGHKEALRILKEASERLATERRAANMANPRCASR